MGKTKCKLNNTELFLKLFHTRNKEIGNNKYYEETTELKIWQTEISLNIEVRKEMEDSRLNAIKQLIMFIKGRLDFSCKLKSTTAATVHLTESLLFNWLEDNHITVDKL